MSVTESSSARRMLRRFGLVLAAALLAIGLSMVVVGKSQRSMSIGIVVGLWGIGVGYIATSDPKRGRHEPNPGAQLALRDEDRQYDSQLQEMLRREIERVLRDELAGLRGDVTTLRNDMGDRYDGKVRLERIETTRVIGSDIHSMHEEVRRISVARDTDFASPTTQLTSGQLTSAQPIDVTPQPIDAQTFDTQTFGTQTVNAHPLSAEPIVVNAVQPPVTIPTETIAAQGIGTWSSPVRSTAASGVSLAAAFASSAPSIARSQPKSDYPFHHAPIWTPAIGASPPSLPAPAPAPPVPVPSIPIPAPIVAAVTPAAPVVYPAPAAPVTPVVVPMVTTPTIPVVTPAPVVPPVPVAPPAAAPLDMPPVYGEPAPPVSPIYPGYVTPTLVPPVVDVPAAPAAYLPPIYTQPPAYEPLSTFADLPSLNGLPPYVPVPPVTPAPAPVVAPVPAPIPAPALYFPVPPAPVPEVVAPQPVFDPFADMPRIGVFTAVELLPDEPSGTNGHATSSWSAMDTDEEEQPAGGRRRRSEGDGNDVLRRVLGHDV